MHTYRYLDLASQPHPHSEAGSPRTCTSQLLRGWKCRKVPDLPLTSSRCLEPPQHLALGEARRLEPHRYSGSVSQMPDFCLPTSIQRNRTVKLRLLTLFFCILSCPPDWQFQSQSFEVTPLKSAYDQVPGQGTRRECRAATYTRCRRFVQVTSAFFSTDPARWTKTVDFGGLGESGFSKVPPPTLAAYCLTSNLRLGDQPAGTSQ
jgi:hypothetical protein